MAFGKYLWAFTLLIVILNPLRPSEASCAPQLTRAARMIERSHLAAFEPFKKGGPQHLLLERLGDSTDAVFKKSLFPDPLSSDGRSLSRLPSPDDLYRLFLGGSATAEQKAGLRESFERAIELFSIPGALEFIKNNKQEFGLSDARLKHVQLLYLFVVHRLRTIDPLQPEYAVSVLFSFDDIPPRELDRSSRRAVRRAQPHYEEYLGVSAVPAGGLRALRYVERTHYALRRGIKSLIQVSPSVLGTNPIHADAAREFVVKILEDRRRKDDPKVYLSLHAQPYFEKAAESLNDRIRMMAPQYRQNVVSTGFFEATARDLVRKLRDEDQKLPEAQQKLKDKTDEQIVADLQVRNEKGELGSQVEKEIRRHLTELFKTRPVLKDFASELAEAFTDSIDAAYDSYQSRTNEAGKSALKLVLSMHSYFQEYQTLLSRYESLKADLKNADQSVDTDARRRIPGTIQGVEDRLSAVAKSFAESYIRAAIILPVFGLMMDPQHTYLFENDALVHLKALEMLIDYDRQESMKDKQEKEKLRKEFREAVRSLPPHKWTPELERLSRIAEVGISKTMGQRSEDLMKAALLVGAAVTLITGSQRLVSFVDVPEDPPSVVGEITSDPKYLRDRGSFEDQLYILTNNLWPEQPPRPVELERIRFIKESLRESDIPEGQKQEFRNSIALIEQSGALNSEESFLEQFSNPQSGVEAAVRNLINWQYGAAVARLKGQIVDPTATTRQSNIYDMVFNSKYHRDELLFRDELLNLINFEFRRRAPTKDETEDIRMLWQEIQREDLPENQRELYDIVADEIYLLDLLSEPEYAQAFIEEFRYERKGRIPAIIYNIILWNWLEYHKIYEGASGFAPRAMLEAELEPMAMGGE